MAKYYVDADGPWTKQNLGKSFRSKKRALVYKKRLSKKYGRNAFMLVSKRRK